MSIKRFATAALVGFSLAAVPAAFADAVIGKPAPAFSAPGADGKTINLKDYQGKTVVLEWTNADCPFVKKHYESNNIPQLQAAAKQDGVVWLQVISSAPGKQGHVDGPSALKLNEYRGATPAGVVLDEDGKIGKEYGAQTTPHLYIVDAKGTLVYKGGIDNIASSDKSDVAKAENYVTRALGELKQGKTISQASTKPYGCSVKYSG